MTARVTALIAARNEARRIGECLASLRAQTWTPLEIVVVDDGSTDDTADRAAAVDGVRVLRRPHAGKARAIAAGAEVATGDILLFPDADMVFAPDYVAAMVAPIVRDGAAGTAHATELVANPDNRWSRCWQRRAGLPPDRRLALTPAQLSEGSIVFRAVPAADFRRVGGFDDVGYLDDQTLAPKLGRRAVWVPDAVCRHYNVETAREVLALGIWSAHTILHRHGSRALLTYLPPLTWGRALRDAWRHRSASQAAYTLLYDTGVLRGILGRLPAGRR